MNSPTLEIGTQFRDLAQPSPISGSARNDFGHQPTSPIQATSLVPKCGVGGLVTKITCWCNCRGDAVLKIPFFSWLDVSASKNALWCHFLAGVKGFVEFCALLIPFCWKFHQHYNSWLLEFGLLLVFPGTGSLFPSQENRRWSSLRFF